jgi:NAD(P)-dependent dehydrogenase (short-subunit alcohol dehydrogenase family)
MRSYCAGETRVEAATRSRRQPALGELSLRRPLYHRWARTVADEVNELGRFDAVIHNAGIGYREGRVEIEPGVPSVFAVNVLAPYILCHPSFAPKRLIFMPHSAI